MPWKRFLSDCQTTVYSILKSRDIALLTKVRLVKAMVFPVFMYRCGSGTIKKAEHQRIDAVELWHWRRFLRVPWTPRRSNQSILKEISPVCSLEGLVLKLKLQYLATWCKELTHWKRPWCWEGLGAGGEGDDRGWDGWMASPTWWTWVSELRELVMDREAWRAVIHRVAKSRTQLSDWTELNGIRCHDFSFEHWVLSQLFRSPLSPLSRGSLVSLHFLPLEWYYLNIWD